MQSLYGAIANTKEKEIMVNVDTVYQRVLTIANKEQRGYITPLEFNLLANQAQLDIFEGYFVEVAQAATAGSPGNETEYSDIMKTLNEKISVFKKVDTALVKQGSFFLYPNDMYKLGTLYYAQTGLTTDGVEIQEINYDELLDYNNSPLTKPDKSHPLYIRREEGIRIISTPAITSGVIASYIKKPTKVEWGYVVVPPKNEALYNNVASTDFELHTSEETTLVLKILELTGIVINKPGLITAAQQEQA